MNSFYDSENSDSSFHLCHCRLIKTRAAAHWVTKRSHCSSAAIRSGTLTSTQGEFVKQLEHRWAAECGTQFAHACSARHAAIHYGGRRARSRAGRRDRHHADHRHGGADADPLPGRDPCLRRRRSADLQRHGRHLERGLSDRTRAIVVTHLFGNPCDMTAIMALAGRRGIPVIEDCAQAFGARQAGQLVGTIGAIGCFSLQQGKHITTGEGGLVVTERSGPGPAGCSCSSTRPGATAIQAGPLLSGPQLSHDRAARRRGRGAARQAGRRGGAADCHGQGLTELLAGMPGISRRPLAPATSIPIGSTA